MKLICIGDSLTFGYGVRPSQRWTRLCAQETGWEIVNEGISGDTTGGMLVRLRALLAERDICVQRPLVLLMGGAFSAQIGVGIPIIVCTPRLSS